VETEAGGEAGAEVETDAGVEAGRRWRQMPGVRWRQTWRSDAETEVGTEVEVEVPCREQDQKSINVTMSKMSS